MAENNKQKEHDMSREIGPPVGKFDRRRINWEAEAEKEEYAWVELPADVVALIVKAHDSVADATSCEQQLHHGYNRRRYLDGASQADAYLETIVTKLRKDAGKLYRSRFVIVKDVAIAVVSASTGVLVTALTTTGFPGFFG